MQASLDRFYAGQRHGQRHGQKAGSKCRACHQINFDQIMCHPLNCQKELPPGIAQKRLLLINLVEEFVSVLVAYSGGVDSSLLSYYARLVLGQKAKIVIALSPSLAQAELAAARMQAEKFDFELIEIATDEVALGEYRRNDGMRCFFCKSTLFEELETIKEKLKISAIAYGANMDDLNDVRPGHQAAAKYNVLAPLLQAGLIQGRQYWRLLLPLDSRPSFIRSPSGCLSFVRVFPQMSISIRKDWSLWTGRRRPCVLLVFARCACVFAPSQPERLDQCRARQRV